MSKALDIEGLDTIEAVLPDFSLSLRARNRLSRTIQSYCEAAKLLDTYLTERGMPRNLRNIGREHVEAFIDDQLTRRSHASAAVRFRSLQQFFRWAKEDGQITASPMANMSPPSVTAPPVPIVKDDHFRLLLKTCEGETFEDAGGIDGLARFQPLRSGSITPIAAHGLWTVLGSHNEFITRDGVAMASSGDIYVDADAGYFSSVSTIVEVLT